MLYWMSCVHGLMTACFYELRKVFNENYDGMGGEGGGGTAF